MRKNMPYPKKKKKKKKMIHRVRVFGVPKIKYINFCPFGTNVLGGRQKQIV
jgi:hypothetical protein